MNYYTVLNQLRNWCTLSNFYVQLYNLHFLRVHSWVKFKWIQTFWPIKIEHSGALWYKSCMIYIIIYSLAIFGLFFFCDNEGTSVKWHVGINCVLMFNVIILPEGVRTFALDTIRAGIKATYWIVLLFDICLHGVLSVHHFLEKNSIRFDFLLHFFPLNGCDGSKHLHNDPFFFFFFLVLKQVQSGKFVQTLISPTVHNAVRTLEK